MLRRAGVILLALAAAGLAPAWPRRTPGQITRLLATSPHAGECDRCHTQHAGDEPIAYPPALIGPDDNTLCDQCHATPWAGGSYGGTTLYAGTPHGADPAMIWPGPSPPPRIEAGAAGKCLNCHDPHGWADATGTVPRLANAREEELCLACHDGAPASSDVRSDLLKPFRHPTAVGGRHAGPGEAQPADFGVSPLNRRHAECEDCHNPHVSRSDGTAQVTPPAASRKLLGASRVSVLNGPAGAAPAYTFLAGSDTLTDSPTEYQLCFKCHSSWTTQPAGQTDLARALNPANPSYHPVEAPGRNPGILLGAFAGDATPFTVVACGDCHGSDLGARGPHGSIYPYILKQPYPASPAPRTTMSDELCFTCHSFEVYANPGASDATRAQSRFNKPGADKGHAEHVGEEQVPCYACHVTHGSATQPFLIATGRAPGITTYSATATGGTCAPTCHGSEPYRVNYAR
jgi:predicted CXXCH cytochrome family protein